MIMTTPHIAIKRCNGTVNQGTYCNVMENFIEIQDLILLKPPHRNVIEFFLLISYARTKWVLNL